MNKRISDFITIFLAIAIITSTGAWYWSGGNSGGKGSVENKAVLEKYTTPDNAFTKRELSATEFATAQDNLTYRMAESLAIKMQEYNPDGPGEVSDPGIWQPTPEMVMEDFLQKPDVYGPLVLDQAELMVKKTTLKDIKIIKEAGQKETANYLNSLTETLRDNMLSSRVQDLIIEPAISDSMSAVAIQIGRSIRQLDELGVPEELAEIHMANRDMLIGLEQILSTPIESSDDPLRSILAVRRYSELIEGSALRIQREMGRLDINKLSYGTEKGVALIGFWGASIARAQGIPVYDNAGFVQKAVEIGMQIWKWAEPLVIGYLKDNLIHQLIQQTIGWIQGNGKPKFVTNWKSFLGDVTNQVAGDFIYRISPKLCNSFGPMIQVALTPVVTAPDRGITCTLDQVMSNVQNFNDHFNDGGWIAYGATLQPSNNFLGAYFQASDMLMLEQAKKKEAAEKEVETGRGFLGTKMCTKWEYRTSANSNINVTTSPCPAGGFNPDGTLCTTKSITGTITNPKQEKVCVEEKTTTPGDYIATSLSQTGVTAPLLRIVNSQDIAALANALVNAAITKLMNKVSDRDKDDPGILGADNSVGGSSEFGRLCEGLKGSSYQACKKGAEGMCGKLPTNLKDKCLASIVPEDERCSDASCDAPDIPIKYEGEVSGAIDAVKESSDLSTEEGVLAYRDAVLEKLTSQGFIGNAIAINCNGSPSKDSIILGKPGDDYAEYFDVVIGASSESARAGIGYSEPADWKRCEGCGQTSPKNCEISGGGGSAPSSTLSTLPQIISLNPNPGWPKALHTIIGKNMVNPIKVFITSSNGNVINPPMTGDGSSVNDGTRLHFYGPDLPDGSYSLQVGSSLASSSNVATYKIEKNLKDSSIVEATIGWNGDAVNNPGANNWLVVSGADSGIYGSIVGDDASTPVPMFKISQDTTGVGAPRVAFSPSSSKYLVVFLKEITTNTNVVMGQFIDATGTKLGSNFAIGSDIPGAVRDVHAQYDSVRNKFVLAIWKYGGNILLKTIGTDGVVGSALSISTGQNGVAKVAINENSGEYCVAYGDYEGKKLMVRPVDANTFQAGKEEIVLPSAYGTINGNDFVYNPKDNKYLIAWHSYEDKSYMARFIKGGCNGNELGNVFSLKLGGGGTLAYNSGSNTYALASESDTGLRNLFIAFNNEGEEISGTRKEVFLDGINGNYVPIVRPNNRTGAYGMASARDYAVYRFAPNMGGSILRVQ